MANKIVNENQVTICFHVNDCKILHKSVKVVEDVIIWLQSEYESIFEDGSGSMKVHRGNHHTYLAMELDYLHKGECCVTMYGFLDRILHTFDEAVKKHGEGWVVVQSRVSKKTAAPDNLFVVDEDCEKLSIEAAASFHTVVAKLLYIRKQARPDTSLSVAFLTTRVRAPDTDDWGKLRNLMEYLRAEKDQPFF